MSSVRQHVETAGGLTEDQLEALGFSQDEIDRAEVERHEVHVQRPKPNAPVFDSSKTKLGPGGMTPSAIERAVQRRDAGCEETVLYYYPRGQRLDLSKASHHCHLGDVYVQFALTRPDLIWLNEWLWPRLTPFKDSDSCVRPDAVLVRNDGSVFTFVDAVTASYKTNRLSQICSFSQSMSANIQLW